MVRCFYAAPLLLLAAVVCTTAFGTRTLQRLAYEYTPWGPRSYEVHPRPDDYQEFEARCIACHNIGEEVLARRMNLLDAATAMGRLYGPRIGMIADHTSGGTVEEKLCRRVISIVEYLETEHKRDHSVSRSLEAELAARIAAGDFVEQNLASRD